MRLFAFMKLLALSCTLAVLTACVTKTTSLSHQDPLKQKVSVTVTGGTMPITTTTPLSWYADVMEVKESEAGEPVSLKAGSDNIATGGAIPEWIKGEIQRQMEAKGFVFSGDQTRYQMVSVITLGDGEAATKTQDFFHLFPSLPGGSTEEHPKGTLLLGIWDSTLRQGVWRSALQTYTAPDATAADKEARLTGLVAEMLSRLEPAS